MEKVRRCLVFFEDVLVKNREAYRRERAQYLRTCLHAMWLAHHAGLGLWGAINVDISRLEERFHRLEKYSPLLLTVWSMAFQVLFIQLAILHDVSCWRGRAHSESARRVRRWRDLLFTTLVVPFSMLVCILFWLLYYIDRELVFPPAMDAIVPLWFNHGVHTNIVVLLLAEMAVQPREEPADHGPGLRICWFFSVLYAVLYYALYFSTGIWLYPIFGVLSFYQICLFQLAICVSQHLFYTMQWPVARFLHSPSTRSVVGGWLKSLHAVASEHCLLLKECNAASDRRDLCVVFKCNKCLGDALDYCACN